MRYPSLNKLYFETFNLPSTPAIWIGCSLALHAGIFLLPLGGSNRQSIAFAPGDAGVQVELVAGDSEPAPVTENADMTQETAPQIEEPPPIVSVPVPEENEVVFAEPEPKPARKVVADKAKIAAARPENFKPDNGGASGGPARAGSAAAQPAAQVFTTQPPYPVGARDLGVEGNVRLRVRVGVDGSPREVEVARSSGRADFDSTSMSTVRREWRFRPARTIGGAPVESTVMIAIHFTLKS